MKKYILYFILFFLVIPMVFVGIGAGIYYLAGGNEDDNPQQVLKQKIEDFQQRHDSLKSLPPRSFKGEYGLDESLYPDDYYEKTQQLYREEIAFIVEQYGEEATAKVVFLISQIPVAGQYFIGEVYVGYKGLRANTAHKDYPQAFDAVCAQIAHKTINSICDYALGLAIGYGYDQMAQRIISCYKPDILLNEMDGYSYQVSTAYQSRDNAKARIAEL